VFSSPGGVIIRGLKDQLQRLGLSYSSCRLVQVRQKSDKLCTSRSLGLSDARSFGCLDYGQKESILGRPYKLSFIICLLSVTKCIVAKR